MNQLAHNQTPRLHGMLPVFQTPFHDDLSIDWPGLTREIHWLHDQGVDGVVLAMVSEVLRLSESERREMAEHVCRLTSERGEDKVALISVGAESTYTACEHARHAESVGADGVMAIPPVATATDDDELRRYYERIVESTTIPVIVQDASGYVGQPLSISMQANLLNDLGQRIGFKPEAEPIGPRVSALRDATDGRARIFEGTGGIALVDSYRRGIAGTMPGADLIRANLALWQALQAGNEKRTYELYLPICALIAMQSSLDAFLAIEKHLLVQQGIFTNAHVRGPVGYVLDDQTRAEVDRLFAKVMEAVGKGAEGPGGQGAK